MAGGGGAGDATGGAEAQAVSATIAARSPNDMKMCAEITPVPASIGRNYRKPVQAGCAK